MKLISFDEYKEYIQSIHRTNKSDKTIFLSSENWKNYYISYIIHETAWLDYFENIFLDCYEISPIKNPIQLVFWESGPVINVNESHLPNDNYAFINREGYMNGRTDRYLTSIYKKCFNLKKTNFSGNNSKTRKDILIELALEGYLIIDLYPTHGFKLNTDKRKKYSVIFTEYTIPKLKSIKEGIQDRISKTKFNDDIFYPSELKNMHSYSLRGMNIQIVKALKIKNKIQFKAYP